MTLITTCDVLTIYHLKTVNRNRKFLPCQTFTYVTFNGKVHISIEDLYIQKSTLTLKHHHLRRGRFQRNAFIKKALHRKLGVKGVPLKLPNSSCGKLNT